VTRVSITAAIGVVHPAAVQMPPSSQDTFPQRRHVFAAAVDVVASACLSVWAGMRGKWLDRRQAVPRSGRPVVWACQLVPLKLLAGLS